MGALNCTFNVATCALSRNNREQIHALAVGASQVEQNVFLWRNCRHGGLLFHARPLWQLSGLALTRRRASDSPFTSARLFGGSIGMMCRCCQKTVGPLFGQQLRPDPIALCPCQNREPAPFNAATPLVTPFVRLISVAVQPSLVFLALQRVGTRFLHGIYFFGHSD